MSTQKHIWEGLGISLLSVCVMGCGQQSFLFLTRPGSGSTGSKEESEAYYAAMDIPPERTLKEWMQNRCFDEEDIAAYYYNETDLGLGREMHCAKCSDKSQRPKLISCAVSNHGIPQGLDRVQFGRGREESITKALTDLENFVRAPGKQRGATVAMDFDPKRSGDDKVQFYIYDARDPTLLAPDSQGQETLIPGLQLDSEGGEFNRGVKYMRNCLACHGGRYDTATNRILGATFLDFDATLYIFANDSANTHAPKISVPGARFTTRSATNDEAIRRMNHLVREVADEVHATELVARIDGSYSKPVQDPTSVYVPGYVPKAWSGPEPFRVFDGKTVTNRDFYDVVVHRYCAMCHFSQTAGNNVRQIDPSQPLTFGSADQWLRNRNLIDGSDSREVIRKDVCGSSEMPHAEVTRLNLLRDSRALGYICN